MNLMQNNNTFTFLHANYVEIQHVYTKHLPQFSNSARY